MLFRFRLNRQTAPKPTVFELKLENNPKKRFFHFSQSQNHQRLKNVFFLDFVQIEKQLHNDVFEGETTKYPRLPE